MVGLGVGVIVSVGIGVNVGATVHVGGSVGGLLSGVRREMEVGWRIFGVLVGDASLSQAASMTNIISMVNNTNDHLNRPRILFCNLNALTNPTLVACHQSLNVFSMSVDNHEREQCPNEV